MRYIKYFEEISNGQILIIVDIQKSFSKFFTPKYLKEVYNYCQKFDKVYQIWDNHPEGSNVSKDYLYDTQPDIKSNGDLYKFPNQKDIIEKRYNYDVNIDFYQKILDKNTYQIIKKKEDNKTLKRGDTFPTKSKTLLVYIGNNHNWYHIPLKMIDLFKKLKEKEVIMIGGSSNECFLDIETAAKSLGVDVKRNNNYIYSATNCPIK